MRPFIGIPLAREVIDELERLSQSLRSPNDGLRWSAPESWHITLQFLGESAEERYDCLVQHLQEVRSPDVSIQLDGIGFFDRAGVFFAGVIVSPELAGLEKRVLAATTQCGFVAESRPFHPHVTLARAKGDNRMRVLRGLKERVNERVKGNVGFSPFTAAEFLLYEVFLGRGGSRYEIRQHFPIGKQQSRA